MACLTLCACFSLELAAQDSLAKYEAQYELERDPVAKAKILAKVRPLGTRSGSRGLEDRSG